MNQQYNPVQFKPQQPIQNQHQIQQPISNLQMLVQKFNTIEIIRAQMDNFLRLQITDQRNILGALLFHNVVKAVKNQDIAKQIVGMLVDPSSFTVSDIIDIFDNDEDLQKYIQDGLQLIMDNQKGKM